MAVNSCCKYLMFFFNLLIFLGATALLGIGIWVLVEAEHFRQVVSDDPMVFNAVYVIIAVAAFLLIVGFLGCCGAIQESKCMLGTFFVIILILFIMEIVGGILAFVYYPKAKTAALKSMHYYGKNSTKAVAITAGWDAIQSTFKCCGINGIADWAVILPKLPPNVCFKFKQGCKDSLKKYFWVIGGVSCGVLFIELLAMVFACCLYKNI